MWSKADGHRQLVRETKTFLHVPSYWLFPGNRFKGEIIKPETFIKIKIK